MSMKHLLTSFCLLMMFGVAVSADSDTIQVSNFAKDGLAGWSEKSFNGETEYKIVEDSGQKVLQATSNGAASGLIFEREFDVVKYPIVSWRWKVENTIEGGDVREKATDDYAARIYVTFPHWFYPKTTSLNYIWANRLPKGDFYPSRYTSNSMMIAVESGKGKVGEWVEIKRNLIEDYRRAFGEEPPQQAVISIMTDTDNTGSKARAWYDNIYLSK